MDYAIILNAAPADPGLALGGGGGAATEVPADAPANGAAAGGGLFGGMNTTSMILMYVLILGVAWFLLIRPQRKQQKEMREMQDGIQTGDNVVTSAGLYGTVTEVNEETFIIEFGSGKSFKVPIAKNHVIGKKEPR